MVLKSTEAMLAITDDGDDLVTDWSCRLEPIKRSVKRTPSLRKFAQCELKRSEGVLWDRQKQLIQIATLFGGFVKVW